MTEQQILNGCKKQDRKCQQHAFDVWSEAMMTVCLRYVKNAADAEEVMLTGFLKFFRSVHTVQLREHGSLFGWLKKITVNECLQFLRTKQHLTIVEETQAVGFNTNDSVLADLHAEAILQLILELPTGYRTVFNLYVIEGYSHQEIAQLLNISEPTSKSQLFKAKMMLQKKLLPKKVLAKSSSN
jgi:RNA polymerase sigma factor (sigma-70 family)